MSPIASLFMFRSSKSADLCCFSHSARGEGLPEKFAPWSGFGVVRADQKPPHGLSRDAIEAGITAKGYQLWRKKLPS